MAFDLEIIGLRKKYRGLIAADDVPLRVGKGQFVCLLGLSGLRQDHHAALHHGA